MNKFFLFLAFAAFALFACSDNSKPPPSHEELCTAKPVTKECLVGTWSLQNVMDADGFPSGCSNYSGSLTLKANGDYIFEGGRNNLDISGRWELIGPGTMKIKCTFGNCTDNFDNKVIDATFEAQPSELKITSKTGYTTFSQCKQDGDFVREEFSWRP